MNNEFTPFPIEQTVICCNHIMDAWIAEEEIEHVSIKHPNNELHIFCLDCSPVAPYSITKDGVVEHE